MTKKEAKKRYSQTEKGKEAHRRGNIKYLRTKRGKETQKQCNRKYMQTEKGKEACGRGNAKWRKSSPEKTKAHHILNNAIRAGKITRPFLCEMCFEKCKPEGHHEDYSKPLEVDWLCIKCHRKQGVKYD